jgi:serine/threonine protein kinase
VRDLENPKDTSIPEFSRRCTEIKALLPEKYKALVEVMQNLLSFNPYYRMTAYEALQSKVFDSVRNTKKEEIIEKISNDPKCDIMLDVDRDDAFDYENSSNAKYSVNDLKNILANEIK